jgi:hypothetical protein
MVESDLLLRRQSSRRSRPFTRRCAAFGRELMRNHLKHCASTAIRASDSDAEAMYDELVEMMYRHTPIAHANLLTYGSATRRRPTPPESGHQ